MWIQHRVKLSFLPFMATFILGSGTLAYGQTKDLVPLTEMTAKDKYKGEDGGLYGGGRNEPPESHRAAALKELAKIVPLDAQGKPSKDGKIVLLSIGMSNTSQEFLTFKRIADTDPQKSPRLVIVDGAQHSRDAASWATGMGRGRDVWPELAERLKRADVTPMQVQTLWLKHGMQRASYGAALEDARTFQDYLVTILHQAKATFPNLRVAYLSSRIYQGYSDIRHPEPEPYETAFAVRWIIQDHIQGKPELNYDPARSVTLALLQLNKHEPAPRRTITISPDTEVKYFFVPLMAEHPSVGYPATVWLASGSNGVARQVHFAGDKRGRYQPDLVGEICDGPGVADSGGGDIMSP